MLDSFNRYQVTNKVLVNELGKLIEKEDRFEEDWSLSRKREIVNHFNYVMEHGGAVIIVTRETFVVGFAVIEPGEFGQTFRYRELSYIHVSSEVRGDGIGKELFKKTLVIAKLLGAEKLYIGAHPSIEAQRFYSRMGCVLAEEINEDIYLREPRDIQLEVTL
ncbi:GNAT family N-acetyltransferase [Pseudalkalibacillus hwajinpoensis]|uniref:GNAT family N-acetyltransferase n=1 Tax=Guptibacillus hwajinpoensis TaxID=208199 RepID=A0A4U1MN67_9BACL|nr:GNAT family N-acetyltransferase [Pseudalkalibacillus hwajinpoensis]TKD72244.1 GNAT family N-acetyltransferase [Pseudalkalibacillus hwajinpoensis]